MIRQKQYTNAWTSIVSIIMFFISFFSSYFVGRNEIDIAFVRSAIIMIVCQLIAKIMVSLWHFAIPKEQWLIATHGMPEVQRRSERNNKERTNIEEGSAVEMNFD